MVARITVEATTPLAVGTGNKAMLTDSPVAKDINGMPFIPATSIAGVVRGLYKDQVGEAEMERLFGFVHLDKRDQTEGSRLSFTDGVMIGEDGKALDDIQANLYGEFYDHYRFLPIRQHVCITYKGVGKDHGKFDNEVVYAGTRFCFEIELTAYDNSMQKNEFEEVLNKLIDKGFRLGGGTRNGYGEMTVVSCQKRTYDLEKAEDLNAYLSKSSSLEEPLQGAEDFTLEAAEKDWRTYTLTLQSDEFFLFGSGHGDDEVDMTPVREERVIWTGDKPSFSEAQVLIPATSVKGAVAHRTAYHYNRLKQFYVGNNQAKTGGENEAVKQLFGYQPEEKEGDARGQRGVVLVSDVYVAKKQVNEQKILNHVAIDDFTGGAIEGALFAEKVDSLKKGETFTLTFSIPKEVADKKENEVIIQAFEAALDDICHGMLPLGGGVNRGNGCFKGKRETSTND